MNMDELNRPVSFPQWTEAPASDPEAGGPRKRNAERRERTETFNAERLTPNAQVGNRDVSPRRPRTVRGTVPTMMGVQIISGK